MAPVSTRLTLAAFMALSSALLVNVFYLQPARMRGPVVAADGAVQQGASEEPAAAWSLQLASRGETNAINRPSEGGGDRVELTRAIQRELKAKGYDAGAVDGVPGLVTRAAIMAYEADHGLALTAEPRQTLLQHIILGSGMSSEGGASGTGGSIGQEARAVVQSVQTALTKLGYQPGATDGRLSDETIR